MKKTLATLFSSFAALALFAAPAVSGPGVENFRAELSGSAEVPAVPTDADGHAIFHLSPDGTELRYQVVTRDLEDVTQAHVHMGAEGQNGPPVVFLFGLVEEGVTKNGLLARGTITESDLIPREGFGATMAELVELLKSGNAYVNVHTVAHPPGEIRGQIRAMGTP